MCIYEVHAHIDTCRRHVPSRPYYETHILSIRAKHVLVPRIGHGVCMRIRTYIHTEMHKSKHTYIYIRIYIYIYIRIYMLLYMLSPREGMREEGKGEEGRRRREGEMDTGAHPSRGKQFLRPRLQDAYEVHSPIVFMYMYRYRYMYRY